MVCWVCGNKKSEEAHVRARSSFSNPNDPITDFKNIISLCVHHHRNYFDNTPTGRMALNARNQEFLFLHSYNPNDIEIKPVIYGVIDIKEEYIKWKHDKCHWYLKAKLIKLGLY